nr:uncharacterized protein LOC110655246 [Ipomoea batatas]
MILVATVAELLEEYTVLLARVLQHVFNEAPLPFPRRVRFLILRRLPFTSSSHSAASRRPSNQFPARLASIVASATAIPALLVIRHNKANARSETKLQCSSSLSIFNQSNGLPMKPKIPSLELLSFWDSPSAGKTQTQIRNED